MSAASSTRCPIDVRSSPNMLRESSSSSTIRTQTPIPIAPSKKKYSFAEDSLHTRLCSTQYTKCYESERLGGLLVLKVTALDRLFNSISLSGKRTRWLLVGAT